MMDNPFFTTARYEAITLEKLRFGARRHIPDAMLRQIGVQFIQDQILPSMILEIEGTILGKQARSETLPDVVTSRVTRKEEYIAFASWWDHAKHAFKTRFPKLGRRLTVRNIPVEVAITHETLQRVTNTYHVCPHLEQDPQQTHMRFMTRTDEYDLEAPTRERTQEFARMLAMYSDLGGWEGLPPLVKLNFERGAERLLRDYSLIPRR